MNSETAANAAPRSVSDVLRAELRLAAHRLSGAADALFDAGLPDSARAMAAWGKDAQRAAEAETPATTPPPRKAISSHELMTRLGEDPHAPFEVGPFPMEMRVRPEQSAITDAMIKAGRAEAFNQNHRTYGAMCRAIYAAMEAARPAADTNPKDQA